MSRLKVFARFITTHNRRLGSAVTYRRGDVIQTEDLEPQVLQHLVGVLLPRGGSKSLKKLIEEHGKEFEARDSDGKKDWKEPAWFKSSLYPAVDFVSSKTHVPKVHHHLPPRDEHGRFEKEATS